MKKNKKKVPKKEENPRFEKPPVKWYKSMRIWFYIFLALVFVRLGLFLVNQGEIRTDDIWLRLLMITFGTGLAWWYVKRREKGK